MLGTGHNLCICPSIVLRGPANGLLGVAALEVVFHDLESMFLDGVEGQTFFLFDSFCNKIDDSGRSLQAIVTMTIEQQCQTGRASNDDKLRHQLPFTESMATYSYPVNSNNSSNHRK